MLNQQGGTVLWGVDSHNEPVGVPDVEDQQKQLVKYLMGHLVPRPLLSVSIENVGAKRLVLIEIPSSEHKPYSLERKVWVRVSRVTMRATPDKSYRMVESSAVRSSRWGHDILPGFELVNCDGNEIADTKRDIAKADRFGIDVPTGDEELLRRLYLTRSGQLTNAAMVLFAKEPSFWSPNVTLRIVTYPGDRQSKALHEQSLNGPAVQMLRLAVNLIQQQTGFTGRFTAGKLEREDRPAYAVSALREGLVNAMVHRAYEAVSGHLRVEIFPEHLVIQNPGILPAGWTGKDIVRKEESHPTNPELAQVFYLRGLMERLGLGGRKLDADCRALGAKPPVWKAENAVVSLTLYRAPRFDVPGPLVARQEKFLRSLKPDVDFKADDYAEEAGVSIRQARRDLSELEGRGLVERRGKGPATVYQHKGKTSHA